MLASELLEQYIKAKQRHKVAVVGHLSSCEVDGKDCSYHIHKTEQIPENVGLSFHIYLQYQDHWRDSNIEL